MAGHALACVEEYQMFEGSYVALVTPFRSGAVDYESLGRIIELHVQNGTAGLVPCGTTGESPTLTHQEHKDVIQFVITSSAGRLPVIPGTGSNSTAEAIELTVFAAQAGAQASLQVAPYYNKPEPEGMFRHFSAIAAASKLPMILYNIPSRTGREISLDTVYRLASEVKEVVAMKEAGGSTDRVTEVCRRTGLDVLSGDDALTLPMMTVGAKGVISVAANFIPGDVARMVEVALRGDFKSAAQLHHKMFPLYKALFCETNPIPCKAIMEMMGLCAGELRLPLSSLQQCNLAALRNVLAEYGLLEA